VGTAGRRQEGVREDYSSSRRQAARWKEDSSSPTSQPARWEFFFQICAFRSYFQLYHCQHYDFFGILLQDLASLVCYCNSG
jgi:hypothetical protein